MTVEVQMVSDDENLIIIIDRKIFYDGNIEHAKGVDFIDSLIYAVQEKAEITYINIPR